MVIIGRCRYIQPFNQEITLAVFYRRDERISFTMFLTEDYILINSRLNFLIEIGLVEAEYQSVCPAFVHDSYFPDNSLVVECVVESFYVVDLFLVRTFSNTVVAKFGDIVIDVIIIVRIVLEGIDFVY